MMHRAMAAPPNNPVERTAARIRSLRPPAGSVMRPRGPALDDEE